MKQVQISEELFTRLYAYFLMDRRGSLTIREGISLFLHFS